MLLFLVVIYGTMYYELTKIHLLPTHATARSLWLLTLVTWTLVVAAQCFVKEEEVDSRII